MSGLGVLPPSSSPPSWHPLGGTGDAILRPGDTVAAVSLSLGADVFVHGGEGTRPPMMRA